MIIANVNIPCTLCLCVCRLHDCVGDYLRNPGWDLCRNSQQAETWATDYTAVRNIEDNNNFCTVIPANNHKGCAGRESNFYETWIPAFAGMTDAGMTDAGMTDAGMTDAGMTDAGMTEI